MSIRKIIQSLLPPVRRISLTSTIKTETIKNVIKTWMILSQLSRFRKPKGGRKLRRLRGVTLYHDDLLHSIPNPWMRQLRKIRLGVSRLLDHTHFMNQNARICSKCDCNMNETPEHYFFKCKAYSNIRKPFLKTLQNLEVKKPSVGLVLDFDKRLQCKTYKKRTRPLRPKILRNTLKFIQDSKRFTNSWKILKVITIYFWWSIIFSFFFSFSLVSPFWR